MLHGGSITSSMFHGMKRINLVVPDEFHDKLMAEKPVHKMLSSFCLDLIAAELDRVAKLAPCPAHAGNKEVHVIQRDECVKITQTAVEKTSLPPIDVGEDVGKGVQGGTPKKPLVKDIPNDLLQHHELIEQFWRVKKGSKSQTAWNLLMTELKKIKSAYNDDRLQEQLELAVNGLWAGITLRNMQRFETPTQKASEPEIKHPAYRDFTAERLEAEAAEQNILDELF